MHVVRIAASAGLLHGEHQAYSVSGRLAIVGMRNAEHGVRINIGPPRHRLSCTLHLADDALLDHIQLVNLLAQFTQPFGAFGERDLFFHGCLLQCAAQHFAAECVAVEKYGKRYPESRLLGNVVVSMPQA